MLDWQLFQTIASKFANFSALDLAECPRQTASMSKRILQFGTSRFLQAHVDFFVHEARVAGQDIGPITVVKTTRGGSRENRVAEFQNAKGFLVHLRGFQAGQTIDAMTQVTSVTRAFDANVEWHEVQRIFADETEIVVSNVGERGYEFAAEDYSPDIPPQSFPAKLLALLIYRFENGAAFLLILPCELVSENGCVLRGILEELGNHWDVSSAFRTWMKRDVMICDTLVDRIVSEAIEPIGAIGEPYGLWAIKREPGFVPPLQHPCITYTDDLGPYLRLKLHILNLGHTYLTQIWLDEKRRADETVREILNDAAVKDRLMSVYRAEVIPGFAAHAMQDQAISYVAATVERFENPFLNHRISDIAQNHAAKIERRVRDFVSWSRTKNPELRFPQLEALAKSVA